LAIKGAIPTSGELVNEIRLVLACGKRSPGIYLRNNNVRLMEVLDKGKAASVTTIVETRDKVSGKLVFENQSTLFIRGAGGFGGRRVGKGVWVPSVSWRWWGLSRERRSWCGVGSQRTP